MKGAEARLDSKERPGRCVYARKGNTRSSADPVDFGGWNVINMDLKCRLLDRPRPNALGLQGRHPLADLFGHDVPHLHRPENGSRCLRSAWRIRSARRVRAGDVAATPAGRTPRTAGGPGRDHPACQHGWPPRRSANGIGVLLSVEAACGSLPAPGIEVVGRVTRLPITTSSFAGETRALSPLRTDCVRWLGGVFMLLVMEK
jgi:hypothetical protein